MKVLIFIFWMSNVLAITNVTHNYEEGLHGIDYTNACITADLVKSIKPVKVCTKYETKVVYQPHNGYVEVTNCLKTEMLDLVFSREYQGQICLEMSAGKHYSGCNKYGYETRFLPDVITINTVSTTFNDRDNFPGIDSLYTFPECQ
jgi:hypothetical protein